MEDGKLHERLVSKLRELKVRLYRPPYSSLTGTAGEISAALVQELVNAIEGSGETEVSTELKRIQESALDKLRERFVLVLLRIQNSGRVAEEEVKVDPFWTVGELKDVLTQLHPEVWKDEVEAKIIHSGVVLNAEKRLKDYGVKVGSRLMVLCTERRVVEEENRRAKLRRKVQKVLDKAKCIAGNTLEEEGGGITRALFFELADQNGRVVEVSHEQRMDLILAVIMHAEGHAALKTGKVTDALDCFFDSEEHYDRIRDTDAVKNADNFNIVWAMYQLQDVTSVTEAAGRLETVQVMLENRARRFGKTSDSLKALRARLLTLNAIVTFHQAMPYDALSFIYEAKNLFSQVHVEDDLLAAVIESTYCTQEEALYFLRTKHRDVDSATMAILDKNQQESQHTMELQRKRANRKRQEKIGKTARGHWVDLQLLDSLVSMGYGKQSVGNALKVADNRIEDTLQILTSPICSASSSADTHPISSVCPPRSETMEPNMTTNHFFPSRERQDDDDGSTTDESGDEGDHQEDRELLEELRLVLEEFQTSNTLCSNFAEEIAVLDKYLHDAQQAIAHQ